MNERASTGANNAAGACGKTCEPLDENNDFTLGFENQTFPLA
jgi:hypothetical protein